MSSATLTPPRTSPGAKPAQEPEAVPAIDGVLTTSLSRSTAGIALESSIPMTDDLIGEYYGREKAAFADRLIKVADEFLAADTGDAAEWRRLTAKRNEVLAKIATFDGTALECDAAAAKEIVEAGDPGPMRTKADAARSEATTHRAWVRDIESELAKRRPLLVAGQKGALAAELDKIIAEAKGVIQAAMVRAVRAIGSTPDDWIKLTIATTLSTRYYGDSLKTYLTVPGE